MYYKIVNNNNNEPALCLAEFGFANSVALNNFLVWCGMTVAADCSFPESNFDDEF